MSRDIFKALIEQAKKYNEEPLIFFDKMMVLYNNKGLSPYLQECVDKEMSYDKEQDDYKAVRDCYEKEYVAGRFPELIELATRPRAEVVTYLQKQEQYKYSDIERGNMARLMEVEAKPANYRLYINKSFYDWVKGSFPNVSKTDFETIMAKSNNIFRTFLEEDLMKLHQQYIISYLNGNIEMIREMKRDDKTKNKVIRISNTIMKKIEKTFSKECKELSLVEITRGIYFYLFNGMIDTQANLNK